MMERRGVDRPRRAVRLVTCRLAQRIAANWRRGMASHPAIVDDTGTWSYRHIPRAHLPLRQRAARARAARGRPRRAAHAGHPRIPRGRLRHHGGGAGARPARSAADAGRSRRAAAPCGRARAGDARVVCRNAAMGCVARSKAWSISSSVGGGAGLDYETLLAARCGIEPLPDVDGDALATLNFSGGTTGAPKATMLRHRNLLTVARTTSARLRDRRRCGLPQRPAALADRAGHPDVAPLCRRDRGAAPLRSRTLADVVARTGATRTSLVPTQLVRCLDHVRAARSAAWTAAGDLRRRLAHSARRCSNVRSMLIGPKIGVLYGLTEAPVTCYLPPRTLDTDASRAARLIQSVGRVLPGYEVKARRRRRRLATSGEVLIRGGNVMAGYWRDEAATRAALRDGWLHTGDIGAVRRGRLPLDRRPAQGGDPLRQPAPSFRRRSRT